MKSLIASLAVATGILVGAAAVDYRQEMIENDKLFRYKLFHVIEDSGSCGVIVISQFEPGPSAWLMESIVHNYPQAYFKQQDDSVVVLLKHLPPSLTTHIMKYNLAGCGRYRIRDPETCAED